MALQMNPKDIRWWFWAVTLAFIMLAVAGWDLAYFIVAGISAMHFLFFLLQERSFTAFPVQIRLVYFAFTLFGLWPDVRLYIYLILLIGTVMVAFFGRCSIAQVLKRMPWNQGRDIRLN